MSPDFSKEDILDGKIYSILSYLSILCIIPLILKKNNPFVLAHGKQGLILFVAEVAVWILSIVVPQILAPLTFILMAMSFWGLIAVLKGEFVRLPIVSTWAEKISL
jgi:fumarate reductase subunit D